MKEKEKSILFDRFPEGKQKALTMSYDDGILEDKRLVNIFNKYGIKGTFHINGGLFWKKEWSRLSEEEVSKLYIGHEIAAHGYTHQKFTEIPDEAVVSEIVKDRETLEQIYGKPVRGLSYPFGAVDNRVEKIIDSLGIAYSRVVETTGKFDIPDNFLRWKGTCHHGDKLIERGKEFLDQPAYQLMLMYVWGHSFEFNSDQNWDMIEDFCKMMGRRNDIWYATNIEIYDYVNALHNLKFSVKQDLVFNPSASDVWISVNNKPVKIKSGIVTQI